MAIIPMAKNLRRSPTNMLETIKNYRKITDKLHTAGQPTFVYLYQVIKQGDDMETAKQDLLAVWQPDAIWQVFIDDRLTT